MDMTNTSTPHHGPRSRPSLQTIVHWLALLGLCSAYLQGGINKALDFPGAVQEMQSLGIAPPVLMACATIGLELTASLMILTGYRRGLAAAMLACFTLAASFIANRYWTLLPPMRNAMANAFYEHLGLVGGFVLVALRDWQARHP
jgi:uncharacterized membrane protein YphA (DoxX/SURF4 family)